MRQAGWLTLGVFAVGCATNPPVAPRPALLPVVTSSALDGEQYRQALEEAYGEIVARQSAPVNAPTVDVEAAASIPIPDHQSVRAALSYFTAELKPSIQESLIRSGRYRNLIDRVLKEYKLPKGLAYLPVIESAYVPTLTSRAGAHGIWQFMPETAREYGLRVDWWVDERADPERSTRAAAAYLKDLYAHFQDWPLALAAYNAGPGRVDRALADNGAHSFWDLLEEAAIPRETRGYVPTFFATLIIATDPSTYGFRLAEPVDGDVKAIEVEGPLSLHFVADAAKLDEGLLRELNPALYRGVLPPGRAILTIPSGSAEAIVTRATTLRTDDATVAICSYTLREGDSIRRLARAIGTTVDTILAMNDRQSTKEIHRGEAIYLPVRARELGSLLVDAQMYYAVKKGDTIYSIARRHKLTVQELRELNQLSSRHKLHAGEKLRVATPRSLSAGGM